MGGFKFRRQQPIGPYVVDFYCYKKKLVIELDGSGHLEVEKIKIDKERDDFLESRGIKVLRFWNSDLNQNMEGVLLEIENYLLR